MASEITEALVEAAARALKESAERENVYVSLKRATLIARPVLDAVIPALFATPPSSRDVPL